MVRPLEAVGKDIVDSIFYMTLGTADETGQPWVSPVYFSSADYRDFYWISSPEARHSKNILLRPQISIVIFDSRVAVGTGKQSICRQLRNPWTTPNLCDVWPSIMDDFKIHLNTGHAQSCLSM